MIKTILVKTDHFKFSSVMFAMAEKTVLVNYFGTDMISFILVKSSLNLRMAFQALGIGDLSSYVMTLCTIAHPFEVCVRIGKIPGGNLAITKWITNHEHHPGHQ